MFQNQSSDWHNFSNSLSEQIIQCVLLYVQCSIRIIFYCPCQLSIFISQLFETLYRFNVHCYRHTLILNDLGPEIPM